MTDPAAALRRRYAAARRHLSASDPRLAAIIDRVGPCGLSRRDAREPFAVLAESIASQQLSIKAADTIYGRFCDLFPPDRCPRPHDLLALDDEALRKAGFSRPKVRYLRDLSEHVLDGRLDLASLPALSDEEALAALTRVKGIGRWTAEIFLMFRLNRLDILPADDLGLARAIHVTYKLRARPTPDRIRRIGNAWRPYRSVAAWYLWASLSQ